MISALQATLAAADPGAGDSFSGGRAIAVDGDTAVLGAYLDDGTFANQGSAYVYTRTGTTWTQQAKLVASDPAADDNFGNSVAISGDTIVVGAWLAGGANTGAAYVFTRNGTGWTQQAKLVSGAPAFDEDFGSAVAVSGDTALIGATGGFSGFGFGSAYTFTRAGTAWTQQARIPQPSGGAVNAGFGIAVALSGDTAVVGEPGDDSISSNQGAAYVFARSGTSWFQQDRLIPTDTAANDGFGSSIAFSGDTLLIGAPHDATTFNDQGSAYAFVRNTTTWSQQAKLLADDPGNGGTFGSAVALSGDTAIIGVPNDDGAFVDQGSAYVFDRSATTWAQHAKLLAPTPAAGDGFGSAVGVSGDTAVIGMPNDDAAFTDQGSAFVFVPGAFSVSDVTVTEGTAGPTNATFTVTRTGTRAYLARVDVATVGGTATEGADYDPTSATLSFNPGVATQTFTVPIVTDATHEETETFGARLSNAAGALIADGSGRATITDDDAATTVRIANAPTVTETDVMQVPATFTISRGGASGGRVTVEAHTFDGTAKAFDDYDPAGTTIVWADGDSADKTFTVMVEPDDLTEATERFGVRLTNATGGAAITTASAKVAITDDDGAPAPTLSVGDPTVVEGAGGTTKAMSFKVTRSGATTNAITFNYATANGTATTAGNDYIAKTGTTTIAAGATSITINVTIKGDAVVEPNETLTFTISNPTNGATLSKPTGTGTITNDD